jgi:phthiocerol/phenolphthiocerol synthesis type-I polyketide synthase E
MSHPAEPDAIAIIGMAARFPGAGDVGQFWTNLRHGIESVQFPTDEQLLAAGATERALADPHYVKATATAPYLDSFDAEFFGLTPREARICDPQMRLFLECAHAALEDAGYDSDRLSDVGVFGSAGYNGYLDLARRSEDIDLRSTSGMSLTALNSTDYLAPLVSYKLGLHGPSLAVLTACSSSLVAVHLAAASLRAGECELALAGGVDIEVPLNLGHWWEPNGHLSRDGHSRPFDSAASGIVFSSGGGLVALKRLSDALADRDQIRAVIRSSTVNNDGLAKVGFTAPSVPGQAAVIAEAMSLAGVAPADLSLVEAHAAGTLLGDPIEVAALKSAFRQLGDAEPGSCALASVKGNVGHLGHAAAVASLIKVTLALQNDTIPASAGFSTPNPALGLADSPFYVPTEATGWPRRDGTPRIAAVNTFGVGGTNAHAIIEQAPVLARADNQDRPRIVVWSARTPQAADTYRDNLAGHFRGAGAASFVESVATLQAGRTPHRYRGAVVTAGPKEAVALLHDPSSAGHFSSAVAENGRVAFLFPGQGTQHAGMAHDLYQRSPDFAIAFDECLELFERHGRSLRRSWQQGGDARLRPTDVAQPLLFALEYSLARAWQAWGVTPAAVLGHGIGEIVAATVAGVFNLADAVNAVAVGSRAVQDGPAGGMLAIIAPAEEIAPLLPNGAFVAAVNGPRLVLVAGTGQALEQVTAAVQAAGRQFRPVDLQHPLHTPLLAGAVPAYHRALTELELTEPGIAFYSGATGRLVTGGEVTDPAFWARQLVEPVAFVDGLDALTSSPDRLLMIEVGPRRSLTTLARQNPAVTAGRHRVLPTLPPGPADSPAEWRSALTAVAGAWTEGQPVDWSVLERLDAAGRACVPGYPYERKRYWVDMVSTNDMVPTNESAGPDRPATTNGSAPAMTGEPAPATVSTVHRLQRVWTTLLGHDSIEVDADFFDLGGNSLTAVELTTRIRSEFGVRLGIESVFDHPTLDGLADQIEQRVK